MGVLLVRTVDRETNRATPSRIHLLAADGKFYAPGDAYARVDGRGDPMFHQRGELQVEVPVGKARLEAVKGSSTGRRKRKWRSGRIRPAA